jgi:hypothetical protein
MEKQKAYEMKCNDCGHISIMTQLESLMKYGRCSKCKKPTDLSFKEYDNINEVKEYLEKARKTARIKHLVDDFVFKLSTRSLGK